jgi:hypothetical protein
MPALIYFWNPELKLAMFASICVTERIHEAVKKLT